MITQVQGSLLVEWGHREAWGGAACRGRRQQTDHGDADDGDADSDDTDDDGADDDDGDGDDGDDHNDDDDNDDGACVCLFACFFVAFICLF